MYNRLPAPQTDAVVVADADVAGFLKGAGPFTALSRDRLHELARQLKRQTVPAGQTLVRQGQRAEACYLLRSGKAESWLASSAGERQVETLGEGALCGELALLADVPNATTVRTVQPCEVLAIPRAALLETLDNPDVARRLVQILQGQGRPQQAIGIVVQERAGTDGEALHILDDPAHGRYYQLSPKGWFLWQRLDGQRSVRDLSYDLLNELHVFDPQGVAEVLLGLDRAGFLTHPSLQPDAAAIVFRASTWQRTLAAAQRLMLWTISQPDVDGWLTRLYRRGVWLIFTPLGLAILGALATAGLGAFVTGIGQLGTTLRTQRLEGSVWLFVIPAVLAMMLLHEAGHGFAVKAFGRHVPRAGLGLYWLMPVAFVDTSEMWLAGRWPRIGVSLAGPAATLLTGSLAALAARLATEPVMIVALYQYAVVAYLNVLQNLNPLMEFDGYYILSDWLDRPNLRSDALHWLGAGLAGAMRDPARLRGHGLDMLYGCLALAYLLALPSIVLRFYGAALQDWLSAMLPPSLVTDLGWVAAAAVTGLLFLAVAGDLRPSSWLDVNRANPAITFKTRSRQ